MSTAATATTSSKDSSQSSLRPPTIEELVEMYDERPALDAYLARRKAEREAKLVGKK